LQDCVANQKMDGWMDGFVVSCNKQISCVQNREEFSSSLKELRVNNKVCQNPDQFPNWVKSINSHCHCY